ncbi:MAG: hypothetical protein RR355_02740 [Oscillospiraceae bacterium]
MKCQKCGTEFEGNFCKNCGFSFVVEKAKEESENHQNVKAAQKRFKRIKALSLASGIIGSLIPILVFFVSFLIDFSANKADLILQIIVGGISLLFLMLPFLSLTLISKSKIYPILFESLSIVATLFYSIFAFSLAPIVLIAVAIKLIVSLLVIINSAKFKKLEDFHFNKVSFFLVVAVIIIIPSILIFSGNLIKSARNDRLNSTKINGQSISKADFDIIDSNYIIRYGKLDELYYSFLDELKFEKSKYQSEVLKGTEYTAKIKKDGLEYTADISVNDFDLTLADFTYFPLKLNDEKLNQLILTYEKIIGTNKYKCNDKYYTFDEIKALAPANNSFYLETNINSKDRIIVKLRINDNGYCELKAIYAFESAF